MSPTASYVVVVVDLSRVRAGDWSASTVAASGFESTAVGLAASYRVNAAWAVAVLVTEPASRSAWVAA